MKSGWPTEAHLGRSRLFSRDGIEARNYIPRFLFIGVEPALPVNCFIPDGNIYARNRRGANEQTRRRTSDEPDLADSYCCYTRISRSYPSFRYSGTRSIERWNTEGSFRAFREKLEHGDAPCRVLCKYNARRTLIQNRNLSSTSSRVVKN